MKQLNVRSAFKPANGTHLRENVRGMQMLGQAGIEIVWMIVLGTRSD